MIINPSGTTITMREMDDFHCHPRRNALLRLVLPFSAKYFRRALVMPNSIPPILTGDDAVVYSQEIREATPPDTPFEPLMTIKITDFTTREMVREARQKGVLAGKGYPKGVTTNSKDGITDFKKRYSVFGEMQEVGMVLSLHGELPGVFCLDRERLFLEQLLALHNDFPDLKIVLEHITTQEAYETILACDRNIAATITLHHLLLTLDDVLGSFLEPHQYCKPVAKYPKDRDALLKAAMSGDPRFFFVTDSAPHPRHKKECASGDAGIFIAPVIPLLIEIFEAQQALNTLENFTSRFGAEFYGLPLNMGTIQFIKKEWTVPKLYGNVVPFMAGKTLSWQVLK